MDRTEVYCAMRSFGEMVREEGPETVARNVCPQDLDTLLALVQACKGIPWLVSMCPALCPETSEDDGSSWLADAIASV